MAVRVKCGLTETGVCTSKDPVSKLALGKRVVIGSKPAGARFTRVSSAALSVVLQFLFVSPFLPSRRPENRQQQGTRTRRRRETKKCSRI